MAVSIGDAVLTIGGDTSKLDKSLKGIGDKVSKVGKNLTLKLTAPLVAFGALSLKAAIDFEDAFAGVRKTVEATEEEFAALEQGIRDMTKELPLTHSELARIAEAAGQLGIEKDAILEFTEVMAQLGMTTNMTGDEAATTFARFANITGMDTDFFSNLGSVIVDLGNNMATTEGEIAAMALRLAGAGTAIGLTETDIFGLSAALSSLGIRAESGGTAFSRIMLEMNSAVAAGGRELKIWSELTAQSVDEFKESFEQDAMGAILAAIGGLGKFKDVGIDVTGILEDLGLGGIRITDALLRATGAQDLMTEAQEIAKTAWEENIALQDEAAKRLDTQKSKLNILKNSLIDTGITIGEALVPKLQQLIDWLMPIIQNIQTWIQDNPKLVDTIMKVAAGLAILGPIVWAVGNIIRVVAAIQWLWNAAMLANPIGLIIVGIVAFGAAMGALAVLIRRHWDGIMDFFKGFAQGVKTIFMGIAESMYQPIRTAVDRIIATINGMIRGLNSTFGFLGLRINEIGWRMPTSLFATAPRVSPIAGGEGGRTQGEAEGTGTTGTIPTVPAGTEGDITQGGQMFGRSGPLMEPVALTSLRTGQTAAAAGRAAQADGGFRTADITFIVDGTTMARVIGQPLVDEIVLTQGLTIG